MSTSAAPLTSVPSTQKSRSDGRADDGQFNSISLAGVETLMETQTVKPPKHHKPRAAWRQRLVQAERGLGNGARQDSIFFVHLFMSTMILVTAVVLNLALWQWMLVTFSLVVLFVTELFNQALKALSQAFGDVPPPPVQQALGMSTAASMLALAGVLVVAGLSFTQRVSEMFSNGTL